MDVFPTLALMNERRHGFTWRESVSDRLLGVAVLNPVRAPPDIVGYGTVNAGYSNYLKYKTSKVREQFNKRS
jgi:hypothetical protein